MNFANLISSSNAFAQGAVDSTPPANPDINSNTGIRTNGVNPNTGDTTGPGAIDNVPNSAAPMVQDAGPSANTNTQRDATAQGSTTTSTTAVPDNAGLNTSAGMGHVGLWAVGILLVAAFLIWAAMRSRRQGLTSTNESTYRKTTTTSRTATEPRV